MHRVPINYLFINYKHHIFNKPSQLFHSSERFCVLQCTVLCTRVDGSIH